MAMYLGNGLVRRLEEEERGRIAVPWKISPVRIPEVGYQKQRLNSGARLFEAWIDVEAGEDGCRESLVRPMALKDGWTYCWIALRVVRNGIWDR